MIGFYSDPSSTSVMAATGPGTRFGTGWQYLTSGSSSSSNVQTSSNPSGQQSTGTSVVGGPALSAQQIDTILANAGSPAQGTGQVFYNDSLQYGIGDQWALLGFITSQAMARVEQLHRHTPSAISYVQQDIHVSAGFEPTPLGRPVSMIGLH